MDELDDNSDVNNVYFKEQLIVEDGLEQRLIVSFSLKYRNYQRKLRNQQLVRSEKDQKYDGFHAVCTNLESSIEDIIAINKKRWKIEEHFRMSNNEFLEKAVDISFETRIRAHFLTSFLALLVSTILEKRLDEKYSCEQISNVLRSMKFLRIKGDGYIPAYKRDELTDDLHEKFGFRTDKEIVTDKQMQNILTMQNML